MQKCVQALKLQVFFSEMPSNLVLIIFFWFLSFFLAVAEHSQAGTSEQCCKGGMHLPVMPLGTCKEWKSGSWERGEAGGGQELLWESRRVCGVCCGWRACPEFLVGRRWLFWKRAALSSSLPMCFLSKRCWWSRWECHVLHCVAVALIFNALKKKNRDERKHVYILRCWLCLWVFVAGHRQWLLTYLQELLRPPAHNHAHFGCWQ